MKGEKPISVLGNYRGRPRLLQFTPICLVHHYVCLYVLPVNAVFI